MTDWNKRGKPFARIAGTGKAVPETVITNADLEQIVDTTDEWITTRSGIKERHIAKRGERTSEYCIKAARIALDDAGVTAEELDFIIIGTISPDMRFPATAIFVQEALHAKNATCWDISATCSGFLYCLYQAEALIALGRAKKGLVIGAELLSLITDWTDRGTCVLFGDGAGAVVLTEATDERGILSTYIGSGGDASNLLYCIGHGSAGSNSSCKEVPGQQLLYMNGNEVFRHAVRIMEKCAVTALERAGVHKGEIDWLVPHQANARIIKATAERVGLPMERVIVTIQKYGNNSSASIPFALDDGRREGLIKDGHTALCVAFGGGFTWGGSVIRF
ncbi:MAG TPA: beta-ketoacyl-ACP synthase III [bacterium]|jgi:3-oxoacyl-[acyl-carrier-protein] synthase-3